MMNPPASLGFGARFYAIFLFILTEVLFGLACLIGMGATVGIGAFFMYLYADLDMWTHMFAVAAATAALFIAIGFFLIRGLLEQDKARRVTT